MTNNLTIEEYEKLNPVATVEFAGVQIQFATPNLTTLFRVKTILEKEPETIEWINSFSPGDVLVDVGANVGMYTIWAAMMRRVRVFAFEPEAENYALLNRNIVLNGLSKSVIAYCAALSDVEQFDKLYLSSHMAGDSCHSFAKSVDHHLKKRPAKFLQGCFSTTLDRLIEEQAISPPNHIKVDVDGFEHKVMVGAQRTLKRTELHSILIEINTNLAEHMAIVDMLREVGFDFSQEAVDKSCVQDGHFAGLANYVFERKTIAGTHRPHFAAPTQVLRPAVPRAYSDTK